MSQDPNLYGQPAPKRQKKQMSLSSTLDFSAQLTSLMAGSLTKNATPARSRKAKAIDDTFSDVKPRQKGSILKTGKEPDQKLVLKEVHGTEEESQDLERARRMMEEKARLYSAMKRGDYVPKDKEAALLVDFDRKWAEAEDGGDGHRSDAGTDDDDDGGVDDEIIEYEDEFGRLRRGTKADKDKMERRLRRGEVGTAEVERMSARPKAPEKVIYGDAIQTMAFNPEDPDKMEELARKRDRSATPPEAKHYDADWEIRSKGVGFYKFSKDEPTREQEMKNLEEERLRTEEERKERDDKKEARRREIEERRRQMEARRARKMADTFLNGLAAEIKDDAGER